MSADQRRGFSTAARRWAAVALDGVLAAVIVVVELGAVVSDAPPWHVRPFGVLDGLRLAGLSLPVLVRRRWPAWALGLMIVSLAGSEFLGAELAVGFYSVGAWSRSMTVSRVAALVGVAAVTAVFVVDRNVSLVGEFLIPVAIFGGAWYLGVVSQTRRRYVAVVEERARQLERDREAEVRRATAAERTRIARDLHDIVAHRVSMMTVQAAAAGVVAVSDPDAARAAIGAVESAGRQALWELRRLVGLLREDGDERGVGVRAGLDALDALAAEMTAAGVPVRVTRAGAPPDDEMPEAVQVSAYRIVQEALTNVLKHAGPDAEADVILRFDRDGLEVEIADTGRGPGASAGGHGLVGMRERASLFGGSLTAGARPGGGFRVVARLPWTRQDA